MIISAYDSAIVAGRLIKEPEVKQERDYTYVKISIAYGIDKDSPKNSRGYYNNKIMNVSAFRAIALDAMKLHKGDNCVVFGTISTQVGNNGQEYSKITADAILSGVSSSVSETQPSAAAVNQYGSQYGQPQQQYRPPMPANDFSIIDGMDEQLPF